MSRRTRYGEHARRLPATWDARRMSSRRCSAIAASEARCTRATTSRATEPRLGAPCRWSPTSRRARGGARTTWLLWGASAHERGKPGAFLRHPLNIINGRRDGREASRRPWLPFLRRIIIKDLLREMEEENSRRRRIRKLQPHSEAIRGKLHDRLWEIALKYDAGSLGENSAKESRWIPSSTI